MSASTLPMTGGGTQMTKPTFAPAAEITGLMGSSRVMTLGGMKPISTLKAGDRIITRNGVCKLRELCVSKRSFRAVRVGKGTLGYTRPSAEMLIAPDQEVMVRDWRAEVLFSRDCVIIPIERMIDGKFIAQDQDVREHDLYELRFDKEEVFYADGVEIISKLTTANASAVGLEAA